MTKNSLLLAFTKFVKSEPIEIDVLRELDKTLESVNSEPSPNTEETLKDWLRNHEDITDRLREFAPRNKEITKVKAQQPKTGVGNLFQELSDAVKQKLKEIEKDK